MTLPLSIKLPESEIGKRLKTLSGWKIANGKLEKEFMFANFPTAVLFVNKLVDPCEDLSHHPSVTINYNRVRLSLFNHHAGGLTEKDFLLAQQIDELA